MTDSSQDLDAIGLLIDSSEDKADPGGLERGIALCEELRGRDPDDSIVALSHYFESNAWEALRRIRRRGDAAAMWEWEQPEYERSILALRQAASLGMQARLQPVRMAQITTNLANALSHVGRVAEALDLWQRALRTVPGFPMALGNHGRGLSYLAERSHDLGHQFLLLRQARTDLRAALTSPIPQGERDGFASFADRIEEHFGVARLEEEYDLDDHALGQDAQETEYRGWVLRHRLFLNPLNELGQHSIAAADPLTLPSITQPISEGPYFLGLFNQLKQEFVSARYLLFHGMTSSGLHFSDRDVKLVDTMDEPVYSRYIEEVKGAFRVAYGLFDKTAFFLNHYLDLGIPQRQITFRGLWYLKQDRNKGLKQGLEERRNISLQALFWLSKDLFEDSEGFRESLEPDARQIDAIRNHLEHKYLKIHEPGWIPMASDFGMSDTLAFSIPRDEFERKTLRVLSLARATLMYLTQCVYLEEKTRPDNDDGPILPMFLDEFDDDRKG